MRALPQKVYSSQEIGALIRSRRKKLGYTQVQLAENNRCSPRFISELERGKDGAGIALTLQIANSIGLDLALIERGSGA